MSVAATITAENGRNVSVGWRKWASSGLSLTVLLTGLFYIQGRAYREGYLDALGLNESQFPIDTPQALWLAFLGWMSGAVRVVEGMDGTFAWMLLKTAGITLLTLLVIVTLGLLAYELDFAKMAREHAENSRWWGFWKSNRTITLYLATLPVTILSIAAMPLVLFTMAFVIMFAFVLLCYPFLTLGADAARDMCSAKRTSVSLVTLADTSSKLVLLECSTHYCALIEADGSLLVVHTDDVDRVEVVPVRAARPGETPLQRCKPRVS